MKDLKTKEKFIELRSAGLSFDRISAELKISKQTLINWSKELKHELANHKSIAIDALCEKFYLQQQHRISVYGEQLERVRAELLKRDLATLPTEKLFDILMKLTSASRDELGNLEFHGEESEIDFSSIERCTWPIF